MVLYIRKMLISIVYMRPSELDYLTRSCTSPPERSYYAKHKQKNLPMLGLGIKAWHSSPNVKSLDPN